jgi:hypothetical protein
VRLPDFVVAGVPRAGTTSLAAHLRAMPDVFLPARKEVHYFTLNQHRGLGWYAALYDDAPRHQVCGDNTPAYLLHADAVEAMGRVLPVARVVVVLRDPVERAYSHYWLNRWKGIERLGFEAALDAEPHRLAREPDNSPHAYAGSGEYARLLRRLFAHVRPERVHVVMTDDLSRDPVETLAELRLFLGLVPLHVPVTRQRINHHGPARSPQVSAVARRLPGPACRLVRRLNTRPGDYPPMSDAARERLSDHFAGQRGELEELLGRPVPWAERSRS